MLDDILKTAEHKMQRSVEVMQEEFASFRTGRAHPALLDRISVEYYGTPTAVKDLATISASDPRTLVIKPWDKTALGAIEKAIQKSDLGINPTNDGTVVRLSLPQPTQERRKDLAKQVQKRAEEARIAIRNLRRDAIDHVKKMEKDKESPLSEEESRRAQERLQKFTDQYVHQVDELSKKKEAEVMEV